MGRNSHYFKNRESRREHAKEIVDYMESHHADSIRYSIANRNYVWNGNNGSYTITVQDNNPVNTEIHVVDMDSVSALFSVTDIINKTVAGEICVLNFASFKNPGGMFLEGSSAQEECLCHESDLYCVLSDKIIRSEYYYENRKDNNYHLYKSNSLYTPSILFMKEIDGKSEIMYAGVITCAAPNAYAAHQFGTISYRSIKAALIDRITTILYHAYLNHVSALILGAYGCGVFGNKPEDVAGTFKQLLATTFENCFDAVIFAVPSNVDNKNYDAFVRTFNEK